MARQFLTATGDPVDVLAYAVGAVLAWCWWGERDMSFDHLAPHYRWMEWLLAGSKPQRCRTTFLDTLPTARHALLLGEGNGRFLREFL